MTVCMTKVFKWNKNYYLIFFSNFIDETYHNAWYIGYVSSYNISITYIIDEVSWGNFRFDIWPLINGVYVYNIIKLLNSSRVNNWNYKLNASCNT